MTDSTPLALFEFDRLLPVDRWDPARRAAGRERPENLPAAEGAALRARLWENGRTLRIALVDDHLPAGRRAAVRELVQRVAGQWLDHANLHFAWECPRAESDLRIAFDPALGNWSYIGTDALAFVNGEITMNLGALTQPLARAEHARYILHEFGHALGLIHEHQGPSGGIRWKRQVVLNFFAGPPNFWTEEQVDLNLFLKYDQSHSQYQELLPVGTEFDPASIMLYAIQPEWTEDGRSYPANSTLSALDKAFIAQCYPAVEP